MNWGSSRTPSVAIRHRPGNEAASRVTPARPAPLSKYARGRIGVLCGKASLLSGADVETVLRATMCGRAVAGRARTARTPRAPARACLSLLPSGPGEVRRVSAARGVGFAVYGPVLAVAPLPVSSSAEDSPSGLWRSLGKRVGGDPSRVQIPHP